MRAKPPWSAPMATVLRGPLGRTPAACAGAGAGAEPAVPGLRRLRRIRARARPAGGSRPRRGGGRSAMGQHPLGGGVVAGEDVDGARADRGEGDGPRDRHPAATPMRNGLRASWSSGRPTVRLGPASASDLAIRVQEAADDVADGALVAAGAPARPRPRTPTRGAGCPARDARGRRSRWAPSGGVDRLADRRVVHQRVAEILRRPDDRRGGEAADVAPGGGGEPLEDLVGAGGLDGARGGAVELRRSRWRGSIPSEGRRATASMVRPHETAIVPSGRCLARRSTATSATASRARSSASWPAAAAGRRRRRRPGGRTRATSASSRSTRRAEGCTTSIRTIDSSTARSSSRPTWKRLRPEPLPDLGLAQVHPVVELRDPHHQADVAGTPTPDSEHGTSVRIRTYETGRRAHVSATEGASGVPRGAAGPCSMRPRARSHTDAAPRGSHRSPTPSARVQLRSAGTLMVRSARVGMLGTTGAKTGLARRPRSGSSPRPMGPPHRLRLPREPRLDRQPQGEPGGRSPSRARESPVSSDPRRRDGREAVAGRAQVVDGQGCGAADWGDLFVLEPAA